jgi:AAA15 family ATPase/GTPase
LYGLIRLPLTVFIDELDSSLHPDLVVHFLHMFLKNSKAGQLIFTTHNQSLLGEKDIARRDCIWITERKSDGSTELSNVWDYPVRKEHSIESLYKKGFLGGKPFLGSIDIEVDDDSETK